MTVQEAYDEFGKVVKSGHGANKVWLKTDNDFSELRSITTATEVPTISQDVTSFNDLILTG